VTQPINTADTTGRLMLNILLSFAQFEWETIADRTRDKIVAARRRGKWTGGIPVLGYQVGRETGKLEVDPDEAEIVRAPSCRGPLVPRL
jgi:site-specific DNA recombinase